MPLRRRLKKVAIQHATRSVIEVLESRMLLTTVPANSVFEFQQAAGDADGLIRLTTGPDTTVELIGSIVDEANNAVLTNLPGRIRTTNEDGTVTFNDNVFGGVAGTHGTEFLAGVPFVNVQALATAPDGSLYYLNPTQIAVGDTTVGVVQLVHVIIDPTTLAVTQTVVAEINDAIVNHVGNLMDWPPATGTPPTPVPRILTDIQGADFKPAIGDADSGRLFFVASGGASDLPQLFSVDVSAGDEAAIRTSIQAYAGVFGARIGGGQIEIRSIVWDQTGPATATLHVFGSQYTGAGDETAFKLFSVIPAFSTNAIFGTVDVTEYGEEVDDVTGLAYVPDDPAAEDVYIVATRAGGTDPSLIKIRRSNGRSFPIADLRNINDTTTPFLGTDIQGLTFAPALPDPLLDPDGTTISGTLIGVDTTSRSLVRISTQIRAASMSIFSMYVSTGGPDSFISIGNIVRDGKDPLLPGKNPVIRPFNGTIDTLRVNNHKDDADNPTVIATAAAGTGSVLIGLKTQNVDADNETDDDLVPVTRGNLPAGLGTIPVGLDLLPDDLDNTLPAGIITADGVNVGKILIGGTITGALHLGGDVKQLYAGWLITGNTQGLGIFSFGPSESLASTGSGNIRDLWVADSVGTGTVSNGGDYDTEFNLTLTGRIGQFHVGGDYRGNLDVVNSPTVTGGFTDEQTEIESRQAANARSRIESGILDGSAQFNNDTFDTAQYLGAFPSDFETDPARQPSIALLGNLQAVLNITDLHDYYAISLMAGQTVDIQVRGTIVFDPETGETYNPNFGIFDPDGRLIATDYSDVHFDKINGKAIRITADRPGVYHIAVATFRDADFTAGGEFAGIGILQGDTPYLLTVSGVSNNLALGGLVVNGTIGVDNELSFATDTQITVENGDLGAVHSGGPLLNSEVSVLTGNLRNVDAPSIGNIADGFLQNTLLVDVPVGGIGLIKSTTGVLLLNTLSPVGQNTQLLDGVSTVFINFHSNAGLSTIRAGNMSVRNSASVISLNEDGIGADGKIDLIDVAGDFGSGTAGGPAISTGTGGDIQYIRVGGVVFRDSFFGGGTPDTTLHDPGVAVDLTDDSGTVFTVSPVGLVTANPAFDPTNPVPGVPATLGPQLSLLTYPIHDKAGVVVINATSTGGITVNSQGGTAVGISDLNVTGAGTAPVADTNGVLSIPGQLNGITLNLLDVNFTGSAPINVLNLTGGNFTSINQRTGGEILSLNAASVGNFTSNGAIGLNTANATPTLVMPRAVASAAYPFNAQHTLIQVAGDAVLIQSDKGVGNIQVGGILQTLIANADHADTPGQFEGINAPVVATGALPNIDIGEGVLPSGSGNVARAGIFSGGQIGAITGNNADIRGIIVSNLGITSITLNNGSLINTDIGVYGSFEDAREIDFERVVPTIGGTQETPNPLLGPITLNGNGGIVGSVFESGAFGAITVAGFGIFGSAFTTFGAGTFGDISVGGYGIRNSFIQGGSSTGNISATSNAADIPTSNFSLSVRQSESNTFDPYFGLVPNILTDLHANLGTSAASPSIPTVTDGGVIEDTILTGSRNLGVVNARQIRIANGSEIPSVGDASFPMQISFGNSIAGIVVRDLVDGLQITTGKLSSFRPAKDVSRTGISIAGPITSMSISGNFGKIDTATGLPDSFLRASGPNGRIGTVRIKGNMVGNIAAVAKIGSIIVDGSITGNVTVDGNTNPMKTVLGSLRFGGSLGAGSLTVNGSVGTIEARNSLGIAGESLTILGNLNSLKVGSDPKTGASILGLNLSVGGNLKSAIVTGKINGTIAVTGALNSLKVIAEPGTDPTTGIINGAISVGASIGSILVTNGSLNAPVTAGFNIGAIRITNGNITAAASITASVGSVGAIDVRRTKGVTTAVGNIVGDVSALGSAKLKLSAAGNIGDGVNPLTISAYRFLQLKAGAILGGTTFNATTSIDSLKAGSIGGGTLATALSAASVGTAKITGSILGNTTFSSTGLIKNLTTGGLGDDNTVDGITPTTITASAFSNIQIKGVVRNGTTLTSTGAINSLTITGVPVSVEAGAAITASLIKKFNIAGTILGTVTPLPVV